MNDDLLAPSAKNCNFLELGTVHKGVVISHETRQQRDIKTGKPAEWDDGKPKMQVVVKIQTDQNDGPGDDGIRNLYIGSGDQIRAVKAALAKAEVKGLEVGGTIALRYDADGEITHAGFNPKKLYVAQYKPPAAGVAFDDLLGAPDTAAPAVTPAPVTADDLI